jgi:phosphoserine phosphatase
VGKYTLLEYVHGKSYEKLNNYISYLHNNNENPKILLAIDYDLTLCLEIQWKAFVGELPDEAQELNLQIDCIYAEKHLQGTLNEIQELQWIKDKIELYKKYWLHINMVEKAANNLSLRKHAKELFEIFKPENVVIISYGIHNIIQAFVNRYKLGNVEINSTKLLFDENGIISGYDENSVVLPSQKGKILIDICNRRGIPLENVVVIGDSKGDELMFFPETLNILVNAYGDCNIKNIDFVLKSTDFRPLISQLKKIESKKIIVAKQPKIIRYY